jgi:hypothetical protein
MVVPRWFVSSLVLLLFAAPAVAKDFVYPDLNCRCTIPDAWFYHGKRDFLLSVNDLEWKRSFALRVWPGDFSGHRGELINKYMENRYLIQGDTVVQRCKRTLSGVDFSEVKWVKDVGSSKLYTSTYVVFAGDGWYYMDLTKCEADPDDDPQLAGILHSFAFLHAPSIVPDKKPDSPSSPPPPAFLPAPGSGSVD